MTTKMIRSLKSKQNRPNYAKRAKKFGLEYISVAKIQKGKTGRSELNQQEDLPGKVSQDL